MYKKHTGILFLQGVSVVDFSSIRGYTAYVNVGDDQRGTIVLVKEDIELVNITLLPPGRGMVGFSRH